MIASSHVQLLCAVSRIFEKADGMLNGDQAEKDYRQMLQNVARWHSCDSEEETYRAVAQMLRLAYHKLRRVRSGVGVRGFVAWCESTDLLGLP